tara:strand:+ start:4138 stop:4980 length:843 start_codon:yes stop_codon:yes gene_type:complete
MKPAPFEYCRPDTLEEAVELLAEFGDDALVMSGGLSLGAMLNMRMVRPEAVIDINRIQQLSQIDIIGKELRIGALARQEHVLASPDCQAAAPLLIKGLKNVGHYQTRSRGTVGGSVAHADPSAEIPLCLTAQNGEIELTSKRGIRRVKPTDFFRGALITDCKVDEIVTALVMPVMQAGTGIAFEEINERHGDFAIVAAAAWAVRDGDNLCYGLGLGGLDDHPLAIHGTTTGKLEPIQEAVTTIVCNSEPLDDRRASATYRRHLAAHLGERTLQQALETAS